MISLQQPADWPFTPTNELDQFLSNYYRNFITGDDALFTDGNTVKDTNYETAELIVRMYELEF